MTEKQRAAIERHGRNLLAIFPNAKEQDPVELCRKLRRLELDAAKHTLELCNGDEPGEHGDEWQKRHDMALEVILCKVDNLLGNHENATGKGAINVPVFINRDPRGYTLKIDNEWMAAARGRESFYDSPARRLHSDWGGYGILAPEINAKGE